MFICLFYVTVTSSEEDEYQQKWKNIWEDVYNDPKLKELHLRWLEEFDNDGIEVKHYTFDLKMLSFDECIWWQQNPDPIHITKNLMGISC